MEDKVFNLLEKMYSELTTKIDNLETKLGTKIDSVRTELKNDIAKTNMLIEQDIKPKLEALFDGYQQNSEKLTKIQEEVSRHEEVILKRVK